MDHPFPFACARHVAQPLKRAPRSSGFLAFLLFALVFVSAATAAATAEIEAAPSDFEARFDTAALFEANQPGALFELQVAADRALVLVHERVIAGADGARTWVGRVRDPAGGATEKIAYITEASGHVYATVSTSDTIFNVVGRNGEPATIRDLSARGYRRTLPFGRDFLIPPVLVPREIESNQLSRDQQKVLPTPQTTIDLMVVYTAAFVTRHGAGVAARLNSLVAQANDSYLRSDVAITLRLVRSEPTAYVNNNLNTTALDAFTNGLAEFAPIAATRTAVGADLMVLLRPFDNANHSGCGVAWVGGFAQSGFDSRYGYAVVSEGSDLAGSGFYCPETSFQHEMGHNMGLMHDRATVKLQNNGAIEYGSTDYAFGYIIPTTSVGDIMSYAGAGVNCFSSPTVFRQGSACNVTPATGDALGVAASNATDSADAARALNFSRVAISNYRAAVASSATISGTISNGSALSGVTFCARPAAGVTCTPSTSTGAYSCTVPNGWTGLLHAAAPAGLRIKPLSFVNVTANLSAQNPVVQSIGVCNLDVDNNGLIEPATDGVAILRRMLGVASSGFSGLSGACAGNTTAAAIFNATTSNYNATGGGATRPGTDGLVILRAMQGLTGTAVTSGLGLIAESGATNTTWATIRNNFLNTTCGADFQP